MNNDDYGTLSISTTIWVNYGSTDDGPKRPRQLKLFTTTCERGEAKRIATEFRKMNPSFDKLRIEWTFVDRIDL